MTENPVDLSGVAETLLIPLQVRAAESRREAPLLRDEKAADLIGRLASSRSGVQRLRLDEGDRLAILLRNRQFDRYARAFMDLHRGETVVHIGCGLDSRFDRVDDGMANWFDLDLPEVIELRRQLVGDEMPRYHLISSSVFDEGWMDLVGAAGLGPALFMAEGVFMYFDESQLKSLVARLLGRFPGSQLVFDAFSPFLVKMNNRRLRHAGMDELYRWGLRRGADIEAWAQEIHLLGEWFPLDEPEPRLGIYRWVRYVPLLRRVMGIYRYQLGSEPAGLEGHGRLSTERGEIPTR